MAKSISALKAEYPQYADVSLTDFANALYRKHYKNRMTWPEFIEQTNLNAEVAAEDTGPVQAFGLGVARQVGKLAGGAQEIFHELTGNQPGLENLQAEQAAAERAYGPVKERYPIATTAGEIATGFAVPGAGPGAGALRAIGTEAGIGTLMGAAEYGQSAEAGAAMGLAGGALGRGLSRVIGGQGPGGAAMSPEHAAAVTEAQQMGYKLTPGQAMGEIGGEVPRNLVRTLEESATGWPFTGGPFIAQQGRNQELTNTLARRAIGEEGTGPLTNDVILGAEERIGGSMREVIGDRPIHLDDRFVTELADVNNSFTASIVRSDQWAPIMRRVRNLLRDRRMTADHYLQTVSDIAKRARAVGSGDNADPALERALYSLREIFDNALFRSTEVPEERRALRLLRDQYRTLKTLEKPGVVKSGDVNLPSLRRALARQGKGVVRGDDPLSRASVLGDYFKGIVPNSGTPTRAVAPMVGDMVGNVLTDPTGGMLRFGGQMALGVPSWAYLRGMSPQGMLNLGPRASEYLSYGLTKYPTRFGFGLLSDQPTEE